MAKFFSLSVDNKKYNIEMNVTRAQIGLLIDYKEHTISNNDLLVLVSQYTRTLRRLMDYTLVTITTLTER